LPNYSTLIDAASKYGIFNPYAMLSSPTDGKAALEYLASGLLNESGLNNSTLKQVLVA